MSIFDYLAEHWGLLVLIIGMMTVLYSDTHLEKRIVQRIAKTAILLLLYSVSVYIESYFGNQPDYNNIRPVLCAVNYSLVVFILVNIIMVMYPMQKLYLYIPAVMNAVLCFISIPTGLVFRIKSDNHFDRGTLGYLPYFISALYLIYLIYNLFSNNRVQKEDFRLLIFSSLTSSICLIVPLFLDGPAAQWFNLTIASNILLYYVFLLQQFTKRDPLTNLLNRQTYYADCDKHGHSVTAVVTMDMNGLKEINDNEGHIAGDTALRTLADCFWRAAQIRQRVYRIGGDEYMILCMGSQEADVTALIERIRSEVAKTPYTCSIGYAIRSGDESIDQMYIIADKRLYEEKNQYYLKTGKTRRR